MKVRYLITVLLGLAALVVCFLVITSLDLWGDPAMRELEEFIETQKIDKTKTDWKTKLSLPPKVTFAEESSYFWTLDTSKGTIKVRLMPDVAPMHVSSTIYLTLLGFYDGLKFHRVIPRFMAQAGCPLGTGSGSPGYSYDGEFDPQVTYNRGGLLGMANTGQPRTDGSQFFLTLAPTRHLDGRHTIFGEIVEGMDVLERLEQVGTPGGQPKEQLLIKQCSLTVEK